ncbi:hypothetical protein Tco_0120690 [Tanacetum coccineum]
MPYPRFTKVIIDHFISKDKTIFMRNIINLHTIRDDPLLGTLKFVSKTNDTQKYGALIPDEMINQNIKDSKAYKTYYDFATGKVEPKKSRKFKKVASPSRKLSPVLEAEPVKKAKRVKRPAKKSTITPTVGVIIRDVPGKRSSPEKQEGFSYASCKWLRVPDVPKYQSKSDGESWGNSKDDNDDDSDDDSKGDDDKANSDDDGNDVHDSERTDSDDDDENPSFTIKDYDEEEHDEEYESDDYYENVFEEEDDDLYKDVDVRSLDVEREKKGKKIESSKQSSSVSSDFASKFLILDSVPPMIDEVASMMNVKNRQKESSTQAPSLFTVPKTAILKTSTTHATTVPPTISMITPLPQLTTPSPAPITVPTTTSILVLPNFSSLFGFDQRVSTLETELSQLKQADHSAQLLESIKSQLPTMVDDLLTSLTEFELKKILLDKLEKSKLYRAAEVHRNLYDALVKSYQLDKDLFDSVWHQVSVKIIWQVYASRGTSIETADTEMPQDQGDDMEKPPLTFDELMSTPIDFSAFLMNHLKVDNLTQQHLTNLKGHQYPFDLSKTLPLIKVQGRQVVPAEYFINNDLEYLKGRSLSRKYTTSITKTKAAKYDNIEGIKDMVQTLWKKRIIIVTHVKVMKKYDYGYLEEIEVRIDDNTLHKFKEGDFPNLNLRDIEDMMLLLVQKKISNLERDVIFDLKVVLRIFTRSIVILKWVEDLQLGVESYQKKLNITKPETFRSDISKLTPYSAYKNPQGIIYQDKIKRNRLMRSDELYKLCDGTLTSV